MRSNTTINETQFGRDITQELNEVASVPCIVDIKGYLPSCQALQ